MYEGGINMGDQDKLYIDQSNLDAIKKYGPELYLFIDYIKNNYYEIPNKNGEIVDSYECSNEEIVNYLVNNQKLFERLNKKLHFDMLIIPGQILDNELIGTLNQINKKIVLYGIIRDNVDRPLLEGLLSKSNCYYQSNRIIDGSLLYILNKTNNFINFNDNYQLKNIYISDTKVDFEKTIIEIIEFAGKNKSDKINLLIDINNPMIIVNFMPLIEKKLSDMNIVCHIEYKLTKEAEMKMAENYSYYLNKQVSNKGISSGIESTENMHFDYIDDYIDFSRMIDVVMSRIPSGASDLDKVVYVSSFVVNYMDYVDHPEIDNIYTILKRGTGVCRDYANITSYLLNKLGVECKDVSSLNSDKVDINAIAPVEGTVGGHQFNVVSIDGIDYFLDNAWERNGASLWKSDYFLVSKELFKKSHSQYPAIDMYDCPKTYPRDKIQESLNRIMHYENNYIIKDEQLSKLLKQEKYANVEYALKGNIVNRSK